MKKFSILLIAAFIAFSCNEKKETVNTKTDWLADNVKGEVQKVEETPYKADSTGKMGEMDSCCINVNEYDSAGNVTKYTSKDSKGNITREQVFTKYDNGLFKEITTTAKGKVTEKISIQIDKDKYAAAQSFDSTGKLSTTYKDIVINEYNEITSMKSYKADSTLKSTEKNTYNKHVWVGGTSKDGSGKETFKGSSKLDDKMNPIEYTNTTTKMDSATHKDSTTTKVTKYKYDSYDDQGNWTQRTEMDEKGKPTKIYKRVITYFKK